jgi:CBS domain-containing protein
MQETTHPNVLQVIEALASSRVWTSLDSAARAALAAYFALEVVEADALVLPQGCLESRMGFIVQGRLQLSDPDLALEVLLREGEVFGFGATPHAQLTSWQVHAVTGSVVAWLTPQDLATVCQSHPALCYFFPSLTDEVLHPTVQESKESLNLLTTPCRALVTRPPVCLAPTASVHATAQRMREHRVSSMLLVDEGRLLGLVTDRDLRNRVVAQGLNIELPVSEVATMAPVTVDADRPAFEALLQMTRHNIHHMPVVDGMQILGMITATDLTQQHSKSAVYLVGEIYKQMSIDGLKGIAARIGELQKSLSAAQASAYSTSHIITAITDAITVRLIDLAHAQLGSAPVDYVWVAAGSQARNEQTAKSDQDNCLMLDDRYDAASHGPYFKAFARFVCDGLAACGYIHCPGEMMAMTDTWRQPMHVWAGYFDKWIDQPQPKALMLTCVFFDLRAIHGKTALLDTLRSRVVRLTRSNSLFLAHMVGNALKHRPPLGMFGQITISRGGDHPNTVDLKHAGIVPIVDLARIYALAAGITMANTHDRLEVAAQANEISEQSARDLREALEFLCKLRIAHQARQTARGVAPDNFLHLQELSNFERSHLKEAFNVVQTLQEVLQQRYSGGRF